MPWVGFEPTISAGERPKTYALDRKATGTGGSSILLYLIDDARSNKNQIKIQNSKMLNWFTLHNCTTMHGTKKQSINEVVPDV